MKITDNSTSKNVLFSLLDKGSVFKFACIVFMKTEDVVDKDLDVPSNAVNLSDGTMAFFASNAPVTVVDAELTVR
jgi:hypothetical protein